MLEHVKKVLFWGILLGFVIIEIILLMMHTGELLFGLSESAERLILYLAKGQSLALFLFVVIIAWMKEAGLKSITHR